MGDVLWITSQVIDIFDFSGGDSQMTSSIAGQA
jgi:hypothetical protein